MRKISIISQKGGVGKTTTSMNLSHALTLAGKKVLLIDMDPQSNLSASLGLHGPGLVGIDSVLLDHRDINQQIIHLKNGLELIPAGDKLGELEFVSQGGAERGFRLESALNKLKKKYDFIFVDCPPSAGLLAMNALMATREIIVPVSSDYLSMQGLTRILGIVQYIENKLKRENRKWIVLTRFHQRRRLANEVKEKVARYFPNQLLRTSIRETVALAESPSFGKTIFEYNINSKGAQDYSDLAKEFLYDNHR